MAKYDVSVGPVTVGPANKMRSRALMDAIMRAKQAASPEQEVDQKMEDARLLTGMGNEPSYGMEDMRMMARHASLMKDAERAWFAEGAQTYVEYSRDYRGK